MMFTKMLRPKGLSATRRFGGMSGMENLGTLEGYEKLELWKTQNRSGILLTLDDREGQLSKTLGIISKHGISLTQLHSKPPKKVGDKRTMNFHIDFEGEIDAPHVQACLGELRPQVVDLVEVGNMEVPWFPLTIKDFNFIGKRILSEGDGIQESDHPGFRDEAYKKRRSEITQLAMDY